VPVVGDLRVRRPLPMITFIFAKTSKSGNAVEISFSVLMFGVRSPKLRIFCREGPHAHAGALGSFWGLRMPPRPSARGSDGRRAPVASLPAWKPAILAASRRPPHGATSATRCGCWRRRCRSGAAPAKRSPRPVGRYARDPNSALAGRMTSTTHSRSVDYHQVEGAKAG